MPALASRVRRARELAFLIGQCAADLPSRLALLRCYASLFGGLDDPHEERLELKVSGRRFALRLRRSDIFTLGEILYEQEYRLVSWLPAHPVIIDAGANIGVAAAWFLARYPDAELHAFEPDPENYRLLGLNMGGRAGVRINQAALTARRERATLWLGEHAAMHSLHGAGEGRGIEVQCLTLADYLSQNGIERVDLLKLDVEGSELEVLRGCGAELSRVGVIVGEVHERVVDVAGFYAQLRKAGFEVIRRIEFADGQHEGVHGFEAVRHA